MHGQTAVLREGVCELECVELDVGVSMAETFDNCGDGILCAMIGVCNFVADALHEGNLR